MHFPKILTDTVEKLIFRSVTISGVRPVGSHLRVVEITGDCLKGATWIPGQIIQVKVGGFTTRAYTPMRWDPVAGSIEFAIFIHGHGPGSSWAQGVIEGDTCSVLRPKRALDLSGIETPVVFFGDETSFGTARALNDLGGRDGDRRYIFEVSSTAETELAMRSLGGMSAHIVVKRADLSHLDEVAAAISSQSNMMRNPYHLFTGQAQSIQLVFKRLRTMQFQMSKMKAKPYWSTGRTGMD
jgi:NADPH-dependent ferric siderophore reductase